MAWGDKHAAPAGAPVTLVHACGAEMVPELRCPSCGGEVHARNVRPKVGPGLTHAA